MRIAVHISFCVLYVSFSYAMTIPGWVKSKQNLRQFPPCLLTVPRLTMVVALLQYRVAHVSGLIIRKDFVSTVWIKNEIKSFWSL